MGPNAVRYKIHGPIHVVVCTCGCKGELIVRVDFDGCIRHRELAAVVEKEPIHIVWIRIQNAWVIRVLRGPCADKQILPSIVVGVKPERSPGQMV